MATQLMAKKSLVRTNREIREDYRPSDDEPFMCSRQRAYFRGKLLAWRNRILRSTKETLQHLHEETAQRPDLADRASTEIDRGFELRARDRQRKLIAKIDAALARLDDGTYGYCKETSEPIDLMKLDARPVATLSVDTHERHERREHFLATTRISLQIDLPPRGARRRARHASHPISPGTPGCRPSIGLIVHTPSPRRIAVTLA